ncbi:MAG: endodeoxyribonuclease RusA [Alphaproteobacteria bacterium]|nr:endodeoxyribonuclease RusA [Alphaproteobacteria bacterium]
MIVTQIILPWPPVAMSPNATRQGNWRGKTEAAKRYKADCWAICKAAGVRAIDAQSVEATIIFCPPSRRAFDLDNALARIKQGIDAIAEAIGVDDSKWRSITLERGQVCKDGGIIVHIHEVSA